MNSPGKPAVDVEYNVAQHGWHSTGLITCISGMKTERVHTPLVFEPVTSDMSNEAVILAVFDAG